MKKLFFITVFLIAITTTNAQNEIKLGKYSGEIGLSGNSVTVATELNYKDGKVTGKYAYGPVLEQKGEFINCKLDNHSFTADWVESQDSKGTFTAIFNEDYTNFIAIWYYNEGSYGGGWTGKR